MCGEAISLVGAEIASERAQNARNTPRKDVIIKSGKWKKDTAFHFLFFMVWYNQPGFDGQTFFFYGYSSRFFSRHRRTQ